MNTYIYLGSVEPPKESSITKLFMILPYDLALRIMKAFIPPIRNNHKVNIDLLGPLLAVLCLVGLVTYGNSLKPVKVQFAPVEFIFCYSLLMPMFSYTISKLGQANISFLKSVSVIGYSYYGHLFTLLASFLCFQEKSNSFFFLCLTVFGGLSNFRLALVFLKSIPAPAVRVVVCAIICSLNILSLIFLHFSYMHRNFVYMKN